MRRYKETNPSEGKKRLDSKECLCVYVVLCLPHIRGEAIELGRNNQTKASRGARGAEAGLVERKKG